MGFSYVNATYFLAKFQNLELKLYTQWETITGLLRNDKLSSNILFLKQNLANSIILPAKNGGLKAWSHGVRKANLFISFETKIQFIYDKDYFLNLTGILSLLAAHAWIFLYLKKVINVLVFIHDSEINGGQSFALIR